MGKFNSWKYGAGSFIRFCGSVILFLLIAALVVRFGYSNAAENTIPVTASVPDFAGMTLVEAKKTAEQNRLCVGEVKEEYSDTVKSGDVVKQSPQKNTETEVGAIVNLVISRGVELIKVPKLTGLSFGKAKKLLTKNKLKYKIKEEYSSVKKGNVISQSLKTGKKVKKGTMVIIYVSKGVKPVEKPVVTRAPVVTRPPAAPKPAATKKPSSNKPKDDDFDISGW